MGLLEEAFLGSWWLSAGRHGAVTGQGRGSRGSGGGKVAGGGGGGGGGGGRGEEGAE